MWDRNPIKKWLNAIKSKRQINTIEREFENNRHKIDEEFEKATSHLKPEYERLHEKNRLSGQLQIDDSIEAAIDRGMVDVSQLSRYPEISTEEKDRLDFLRQKMEEAESDRHQKIKSLEEAREKALGQIDADSG